MGASCYIPLPSIYITKCVKEVFTGEKYQCNQAENGLQGDYWFKYNQELYSILYL